MNLTQYTLNSGISCIKFIHPQITHYAFGKLNYFIHHARYSDSTTGVGAFPCLWASTSSSKQRDNIGNIGNNLDGKDYYIKQIIFGDRILYFTIPYTKCDPSVDDDTIIGNKYIDPDTWMDIPPYN